MGILSLLGPLLPWLAVLLAAVAGYFGIKHAGVAQERARQEAAQAKAEAQLQKRVEAAKSQDAGIDAKVEEKINEIKATKPANPSAEPPPRNGDRFQF